MKRWPPSVFLILAIVSGVLAGTPMHAAGDGDHHNKCCKKAMSRDNSPEAAAARLCCATNCSDPVPNSGTMTRTDVTPVKIAKADRVTYLNGVFDRHFISIRSPRHSSFPIFRRAQPLHIRFHSILI